MTRILLVGHEPVGERMAGPAIRTWELARVLGRCAEVTLAVPGSPGLPPDGFRLLPYTSGGSELQSFVGTGTDVIVASGHLIRHLPCLRRPGVPLVADVYIPSAVESLAWNAGRAPDIQAAAWADACLSARSVARQADWLVCASEPQRTFWLGVLASHGRLHPGAYAADADLRNLVDVVPFGCPPHPPQPRNVLKGVWPGIGVGDRVILWSGGVWNWLDPVTLIRAMPQVLARHPGARLLFLGADHPDTAQVPRMEAVDRARAASRELGLDGCSVLWGNWVPYADRGAFLLEADVGVSLHPAGLEPALAFRTRLLDAIWAGLPMVLSRGDPLAAEFERRGLGTLTRPGAVDEVAAGVCALLDEPDARGRRRAEFDCLRREYAWERAAEPLVRFCLAPRPDPHLSHAADLVEADSQRDADRLEAEVARLESLVRGYESGRLMRLLAALRRPRRRRRR